MEEKMNCNRLYGLIATTICDVKVEYGSTLKIQDYIYITYGRVLDKLSDHSLSFKELSNIAYLIRRGVQAIEKEEY